MLTLSLIGNAIGLAYFIYMRIQKVRLRRSIEKELVDLKIVDGVAD